MPSYRYCRSDDIPLLVQAYNECYRVHFPDLPRMSVERFKGLLRRIDLWTSSCMIALSGDEPIAVLLATKREDETLIHAIGVRPGHQRQGHARHLLRSLSSKLAILGPPRMVAEVPRNLDAARALLEAGGYREERVYTDFLLRSPAENCEPSPLVIPVRLEELQAHGVLDSRAVRCWARSPRTLLAQAEVIRGLAVAPHERIEAWLLLAEQPEDAALRLLAFDSADARRTRIWFELLLRQARRDDSRPLRIDRVWPGELEFDLLHSCGFEAQEETLGYAAEPVAG